MDQRLFLDVNRFAARTAWAHSVAAFLARPWALAILALLVLVAMLRARAAGLGGSDLDQIAALIWVVVGAGLALAVSLPIVHLVGGSDRSWPCRAWSSWSRGRPASASRMSTR